MTGVGKIRFSDGVTFDTDGGLRVERRADGYYVVGHRMLVPVGDREDGQKLIDSLRNEKS